MIRPTGHRHLPEDDTYVVPSSPRASRTGLYAPSFVRQGRCRRCGRVIALVPEATNRQAYWRTVTR